MIRCVIETDVSFCLYIRHEMWFQSEAFYYGCIAKDPMYRLCLLIYRSMCRFSYSLTLLWVMLFIYTNHSLINRSLSHSGFCVKYIPCIPSHFKLSFYFSFSPFNLCISARKCGTISLHLQFDILFFYGILFGR